MAILEPLEPTWMVVIRRLERHRRGDCRLLAPAQHRHRANASRARRLGSCADPSTPNGVCHAGQSSALKVEEPGVADGR